MLVASMREYFRETLQRTLQKQGTSLTDTAQVYVVNLLTEFARSERAFAGTERGERFGFVDLLQRAQDSEPQEALRIYKHMGDSSLYLTGFFAESVQGHGVAVDYYVSMGGSAYDACARMMRPTAATSSALFAELAERFEELVELLCAMSLHGERTAKLDDARVLGLVDRYRRTGKREVLDALKAQGVVLRPLHDDDDLVH
ncbi:MAG: hypothetical protein FJ137_01305 [Deltaproteobacteria bacterium]|nr:hypothetical protein [Deltaproteobacteria bacterium]